MKKKPVPNFSSEEAEHAFWSAADATEYVEWSQAQRVVLSKLKPSHKTISVRLPASMLEELKLLANKRDVPYQSLLKLFLAERLDQELKAGRPRPARIRS